MNAEEPKLLSSHNREEDIPALSKSGMRAFELLKQDRNKRKLKYPSQVVSAVDPPDIRINGNICSVVRDDYFAPKSSDGDYNKTEYDGCAFPISLLYDTLSRITPGGKVTVHGRAIFRSEHHEWGYGWEEINHETIKEEDIAITLVLSRSAWKVTLFVQRNNRIYEKIERKANPLTIFQKNIKPWQMDK